MKNSLGINKPPAETRVVVAMSGGVDSSVVACMLKEEGYDVVGITLQLYDHGAAIQKKGACCAGQDIADARRVAEQLGIPHYVLNYESKFKESVIDDFAKSYMDGFTPVPCVRCNQSVKFRDLLKTAQDLGADALATGHYVQRKVDETERSGLYRGVDDGKDQSYFLFATTQEQLDFLRFPLGGQSKDVTREIAESFGLPVFDKPDSQDICFVPEGDYASVIAKLHPDACEGGEIVHVDDGQVVGTHDGIIGYTVGQRRGLNVGGTEDRLYVVRLDPEKRQVIVGGREHLRTERFYLSDINWLGEEETKSEMPEHLPEVWLKWRSVQSLRPANLTRQPDGRVEVELLDPDDRAIAPGQACVMYGGADKRRVLGGGWITREHVA